MPPNPNEIHITSEQSVVEAAASLVRAGRSPDGSTFAHVGLPRNTGPRAVSSAQGAGMKDSSDSRRSGQGRMSALPGALAANGTSHERREARPPSPRAVMQTLHMRGIMGKQASCYRSELDAAVASKDEDIADLAQHRMECLRAAQQEGRKAAAQWRDRYERQQQIYEMHWQFQIPENRKPLEHDEPGRHVPTPTNEGLKRSHAISDVSWAAPGGGKTDDVKPRRPLELRMKNLNKGTKLHWKETRAAAAVSGMTQRQSVNLATAGERHGRDGEESSEAGPKVAPLRSLRQQMTGRAMQGADDKTMRLICSESSRRRGSAMEADKQMLMQAFAKYDMDHSETLDQAELLDCLADIGLRPKTPAERKELRDLIWGYDRLQFSFAEFATGLVPQVRDKLTELRRPRLTQLFHSVDAFEQGLLAVEEIQKALRRHGMQVSDGACEDALRSISANLRQEGQEAEGRAVSASVWRKAELDPKGFIAFVRLLQERTDREHVSFFGRIARQAGLTKEEEELWQYDLVDFYRMFHEYDPCSGKYGCSKGSMDETQLVTVLRESGYMPKTRARQVALGTMISKAMRPDGSFEFNEFLQIMQNLRELDRERLRKSIEAHIFQTFGRQGLQAMAVSDLGELLSECGVMPRTQDERIEIRALIEDSDREGSGMLTRDEVVVLCQRVNAKVRAMMHERERQYVLHSGWTETNFAEFRSAFQNFDEDMSEVLERDELMKAVEVLKGTYWQSQGSMRLMFMALGINPEIKIEVNFLTFLHLLKMLDDSEGRRHQGALIGFSRDQSDKLYSAFSSLEPESAGTVRRETVQQAVEAATARHITKLQLLEPLRILGQEPPQIEFVAFLRTMKIVEGVMDNECSFEECVEDVLSWVPEILSATAHHDDDLGFSSSSKDEKRRSMLSKVLN